MEHIIQILLARKELVEEYVAETETWTDKTSYKYNLGRLHELIRVLKMLSE